MARWHHAARPIITAQEAKAPWLVGSLRGYWMIQMSPPERGGGLAVLKVDLVPLESLCKVVPSERR